MSINVCIFTGRLTRDPETIAVGDGKVVKFGIALNRRYKTKAGEQKEEVTFLDLEAWGPTGTFIAEYFKKGDPIELNTSVRQDTWEKDGQKRSKLVFRVNDAGFVMKPQGDGKRENEEGEEEALPAKKARRARAASQGDDDSIPF
jgi:single-strand DNA-binding protein